MGDVISLEEEKVKRNPHMRGQAHCLLCGKEEIAVAPVGTTWMKCSGCHAMKLRFDGHVPPTGYFWVCNCGSTLFYLSPDGAYCPNCGIKTSWEPTPTPPLRAV